MQNQKKKKCTKILLLFLDSAHTSTLKIVFLILNLIKQMIWCSNASKKSAENMLKLKTLITIFSKKEKVFLLTFSKSALKTTPKTLPPASKQQISQNLLRTVIYTSK